MRITKKIISLLLVVSMLASFMTMTGFEAGALALGSKKTDFGLQFDDTTRKFKVLQLADIQTDVGDSKISAKTRDIIRMAMELYSPDLIMLSGDQTQGGGGLTGDGALTPFSDWSSSIDKVFQTFTPYMKPGCKVVAVPGNHEYDYEHLGDQWDYYNKQSWYLDWDNNFSDTDLNGNPGAGNVTVLAGKGSDKVALNIAMFNSKGDDEHGYLRPGGDDETAYQEIVSWFKNTDATLASNTYSYKAQVTGASSAQVPTFGMQHVILQEIFNSLEDCEVNEGIKNTIEENYTYSYLLDCDYMRFKPGLSYTGTLGEGPCPSTLGAGSTRDLYDALLSSDFLGMCFGHDHLNTFDITDAEGFRYLMGGALTSENYNNDDPNVRYMEFTLDDTTGNVTLESEIKSYYDMTVSEAVVDNERIEALNPDGEQLVNTFSVPRTIYVGAAENNTGDVRNVQEFGNVPQAKLLDYQTKTAYDQDLTIKGAVPTGSIFTYFSATCNGTAVTLTLGGEWEYENKGAVDVHTNYISTTANNLTIGDRIEYVARYKTPAGVEYEMRSVSYVESIKQPAGYADWSRSYRKSSGHIDGINDTTKKEENWIDVTAVQTLSGKNVYATARETDPADNGGYSPNIYVQYGPGFDNPDDRIVFKHADTSSGSTQSDTRFPMMYYDPDRQAGGNGLLRMNGIDQPAINDIYIDTSVLGPVADNDPRLDIGVRIDYWLMKNTDNEFPNHAAGIGFYDGDLDYDPNAAVPSGMINPSTNKAYTYQELIKAEIDSNAGEDGTLDQMTTFLYDGYASQQSNRGIGSTHVNSNTDSGTYIGKIQGNTKGYPLVADSVEALNELPDGYGMTMFTGVRVKGHNSSQNQHMVHLVAPYYLRFHVFDKSSIRSLIMQEISTPRMRSDYPNVAEGTEKAYLWDNYTKALYNAMSCYARRDVANQESIDLNRKMLINAIAALERSNLEPDMNGALTGKAPLSSVSVPPILYVNGTKIQTTSPYTDINISVKVPTNTETIKIFAIDSDANGKVKLDDEGNEVVNTKIKFTGGTLNSDGTTTMPISSSTATVSIASGSEASAETDNSAVDTTANGDGYVYYKIVYTMKDGTEHQMYAASYVRATTFYQGVWKMYSAAETGRDWASRRGESFLHYHTLIDTTPIIGTSGASAVVALYPIQGNDSFSAEVNYPTADTLPHGDASYMDGAGGKQGWAVGTIKSADYGGGDYSSWREADKVMYYNDRERKNTGNNNGNVWWAGLQGDGGQSREYIVAHIFYNKQAVTSSTKLQTNIKTTHKGYGNQNADHHIWWHEGRYDWTLSIGNYYGNQTASNSAGTVLQFASGSTLNNRISNDGDIVSGIIQNAIDLTSVSTNADDKRGLAESAGFLQRWNSMSGYYESDTLNHSSNAGVGFRFNAVDRSEADKWIETVRTTSLNAADIMPEYWASYRAEVLKAYVAYGNLWGEDFDSEDLKTLMESDGIYRRADYSVLINAINKVATEANGSTLLTLNSDESISDYDVLKYNVYPGDEKNGKPSDDERYVGYAFHNTMFESNARDLIELIQGRVEVYESVLIEEADDFKVGDSIDESAGNLHLAHMDFRYEYLIENYANAILAEWEKLRLADADYTDFNKYVNYVNFDRQLIRFHRDDHAAYAKHSEDAEMRNYANEKSLDYGVFTTKSWQAFVATVDLPADQLNLKKPSEQEAIVAADDSGKMPQIYPKDYNFTFAYGVDKPDETECLYNTARNAYEELEFRRAAEYYSADGTYTEEGVTYYANYNTVDKGSSYVYSPVFKTNENSLTSDVESRGYGVVDKLGNTPMNLKETFDKGNTATVIVTDGVGNEMGKISPWTPASWGDTGYGFQDAYEDAYCEGSHYYKYKNEVENPETNEPEEMHYALYIETKILPEIASADYYFDKLEASVANQTYLDNQRNAKADYEPGGDKYSQVEKYKILDKNGQPLEGGAQWYTEESWKAFNDARNEVLTGITGKDLAGDQAKINALTQKIYQARMALQLRPMEDYITDTAMLDDAKDFGSINAKAEEYYNVILDKVVKVFSLRDPDPAKYITIAGNDPLFTDHPYYNDAYITALKNIIGAPEYETDASGNVVLDEDGNPKYKYKKDASGNVIKDANGNPVISYPVNTINYFKNEPMATNISAYEQVVKNFKAKYDENNQSIHMNKADTSTLQLLLNQTWIPEYDVWGKNNKPGDKNLNGDFDGSKWYTADSWENYVEARTNALKFFDATEFEGAQVSVIPNYYGHTAGKPQGNYFVNVQGAEFAIDKNPDSPTYRQPIAVDGTELTGTVNKAAYDLVVAYYRLQYKKISDADESFKTINDTDVAGYQNVVDYMAATIADLKAKTVDVYFIDEAGNLVTEGDAVKRSAYSEAYIAELTAIYNTVSAWGEQPEYELDANGNETTTPNYKYAEYYNTYLSKVAEFNETAKNPESATVYMDGWNSLYGYLNKNAAAGLADGQTAPVISDTESMNDYFRNIYGNFYDPEEDYNKDDKTISGTINSFKLNVNQNGKASLYQEDANLYLKRLYADLTAEGATATPSLVRLANEQAYDVIGNTSGNAYDPYPLNGRTQVTGITEYTPDSMQDLKDVITDNTKSVPFWTAKPSQTGYNSTANMIDGSYADNMWAAAGLTTAAGKVYDADKALNDRYVLVRGGRFLAALEDAVAHAESKLYDIVDGEKVLKTFVAVSGDGLTKVEKCIYTEASVNELLPYLTQAASVLAETENFTEQKKIDELVFNILEQTDDTIFVSDSNGELYNGYTSVYKNDGLVLEGVNLEFLKAELATMYTYDGITPAAQTLVNDVWGTLGEDGLYDLQDDKAYIYFTSETWKPYTTSYGNGVTKLSDTTLTSLNQADINALAAAIYEARNALKWNTIGTTNDWKYAYELGAEIEQINAETVNVYVFTNSKLSDDGTYLTAPYYEEEKMSKYGSEATSAIISAWNTFKDKYPADADYSHYAQMLIDYANLKTMKNSLQAKSMTNDSDFAKGANQLIADFIAGSYDYKSNKYVADYQTTIATGLSDAEKTVRETQFNTIKGYLNEIDALLNGNAINDSTTINVDGETKSVTYIEALNHYTMKLYEYVTTTKAQYAGFALDMRQNMIDYFNTTIDVIVAPRGTAAQDEIIYQKEVRVFNEQAVNNIITKNVNPHISNATNYPTINVLDDCVGLNLAEDINYTTELPKYVGVTSNILRISALFQYVGAYSQYYAQVANAANIACAHDTSVLSFLTNNAIRTVNGKTYILADPATAPMPGGAELYYAMDIDPNMYDGEWYTDGYGLNILGDGDMYYLAAGETITGSEAGGWFTDASYNALNEAIKQVKADTSYSTAIYGKGTQANAVNLEIRNGNKVNNSPCWNAENRERFINAITADQQLIDESAAIVYENIMYLELLPATDAYREVAGLIYAAMGKVPSYSTDDKTGVIINNDKVGTLSDFKIGSDVCGQVFNTSLLTQLGKPDNGYYVVEDENGTRYYAPGLPAGYTGGAESVDAILRILQTKLSNPITIDQAVRVSDNTANNGINSVKEEILIELEKLTLGLANLSLITSLTKAFLYNNPSHSDSLGSYAVDSEFFALHEDNGELGRTPNASNYKTDPLMMMAGTDVFHESGFYDFSKYTTTSLNAVIEYLQMNYIIDGDTAAAAANYKIETKEGFNIEFGEANYGTLYGTAVTQQKKINDIYAGLVTVINNLELRAADTVSLKKEIAEADSIKLNKDLYDYESAEGKAAWDEFINASQNAESYSNATIINEKQVGEAEEALARAIKALKLNVDSYAPIVTIHNTQSDLTEFHAAHPELVDTIKANEMIAPSYMETGLGNYTLYVYTNQINPHIVVSLEDATSVVNSDNTTRNVKTSKPEKMTVTAHAMSGVTASVITPVLDETNGSAIATQSVAIAGENATAGITSVSTQTAKTLTEDDAGNEIYNYAANSSAYVVLNPSFEGVEDGAQSAVKYSITATDSAVKKVDNEDGTQSIVPNVNSASSLEYATGSNAAEDVEGDITVFVYYMNAMPDDGNDNGVVDGKVNASAVLTTHEKNGIAADKWTNSAMLYRTFAKPVRSWEFSETPAQFEAKFKETGEVATYYDPTFEENNFGSFVYVLDPEAAEGTLDYNVAKTYFTEGSDAAKTAFINALRSNVTYIAQFNDYVKSGSTTGVYGYKHYGATDINGNYENWMKPMGNIPNGALVFIHVADRFGNVCNRLVKWNNYDPIAPVLSTSEAGKVSVTEPGGSGVAKVDLFKDMGTSDASLYLGNLYGLLHIEGAKYAAEGNTFTITAGKENANKHFTVAVTDNAGNVKSIPVNTDADGNIEITVTQTFENVANYNSKPASDVTTESGEDLSVIEFVFNGESTVLLNYIEPTSIVKAGPDGNVFANRADEPLNIIAKAEVESIKLYNVVTGTEEIWTTANAEVTENNDGTNTWTVYYKFAEGEHSYKATAMVNGDWEATSVDFDFTATTKVIVVKVINIGVGRTKFSYNDGDINKISTMASKEVPYGSVVKLYAEPLVETSKFYYWKNDYSDRIVSAANIMEFVAVTNMELTAQFTTNEVFKNDKKLVVYVNNAENVVDSFELADGEDYKVPAAPSLAEHVFKSWSMTKDEVLASEEKMIIVRPVYSLVVKNTVTLTEGNWTATGAGEYESVGNERALATISASATDEAGAGFLYWLDAETGDVASYNRTYMFHVIKDTKLTPVYGDASAVLPVPVARISTFKYDDKADKVSFYAERSVPAGYTMIQTGIVVTKSASVANNEAAFIIDASGVSKGTSNSMASSGFYSASVSATTGVTVYARAYMIYANADGDIINYYSPVSSFTA